MTGMFDLQAPHAANFIKSELIGALYCFGPGS